ncbi:acyltransferase [Dysgonamonadaceae bacterium]|nr:acyltransferase [Dysgonamonadaceae bacterium]
METENSIPREFDDIRPLLDSEVAETVEALLADPAFRRAAEPIIKPLDWEQMATVMRQCKTILDFQQKIIYPPVISLIHKTTSEFMGFNWENVTDGKSHVFISNHRDIVLDAAFLNMLLYEKGLSTTEIAIGDNLLIYPWITRFVRLNKSFIVKRGVSIRQMLETSKHLSDYIHYTVGQRQQSIWIAQREGRAKDSNDRTQTSLLKMMTLHDSAHPLEMLQELNIVPLSISYEFDPCDYLKAKEFQLKRDNPQYKKRPADDIENMIAGITGWKGRAHFRFGKGINEKIILLKGINEKGVLLDKVAKIIDEEIYRNYSFFPFNYVAYDLLTQTSTFADKYTPEDAKKFEKYLETQIQKINIPNKDHEFLRAKIIEMYGNTVKNYVSTVTGS